jgi:hypothetical protein
MEMEDSSFALREGLVVRLTNFWMPLRDQGKDDGMESMG